MAAYQWVKVIPKSATRPLSSGMTNEMVKLADKLIATRGTLKLNNTAKDTNAFVIGIRRALARRGYVPVWWVDPKNEEFWYLQCRAVAPQRALQLSNIKPATRTVRLGSS